jgi:hypothetical protein
MYLKPESRAAPSTTGTKKIHSEMVQQAPLLLPMCRNITHKFDCNLSRGTLLDEDILQLTKKGLQARNTPKCDTFAVQATQQDSIEWHSHITLPLE